MITFLIGLFILFIGYLFYSRFTENLFGIENKNTPAFELNDGIDYVPMNKRKNMFIHLLNIAGLGPILGAIQGILFGPIAFILIPLGCVFMGGVHDYFAGMLSVRNQGAQVTDIIKKYLGEIPYKIFIVIVAIMLLLLTSVFVYTAGDILAERFFNQTEFTLSNPIVICIYIVITAYYLLATLFPIDKIIGRFYPMFCLLLLLGTGLVLVGFFTNGIELTNLTRQTINIHPLKQHIIPMFFMTVSCGLLSGFHSTQATIISRTLGSEKEGKHVFYGMMCIESLIAMIWAAAAMHVYSLNLAPQNIIGTANVINTIADVFVNPLFVWIVAVAVVILPITSGDTALRGLRMIFASAFNLDQKKISNRLLIVIPIAMVVVGIILWAKTQQDSFTLVWRYFNFVNQLITIPIFLCGTIYLYNKHKNVLPTLLPAIFYIFITSMFILNNNIGFNLGYQVSVIIGVIITVLSTLYFVKNKLLSKNEMK